jgi:hypothetical protein
MEDHSIGNRIARLYTKYPSVSAQMIPEQHYKKNVGERRMKEVFAFVVVLVAAFTLPAWSGDPARFAGRSVENRTSGSSAASVSTDPVFVLTAIKESHMKIRLSAGNTVLTATMLDNETSRDLMSLLPLTVTFKDYAGTEKITYLPRRLSSKGAPAGMNPSVGDIAYFAPWGNIAIYYQDFGFSEGLIKIGHIASGIEEFAGKDVDFAVTIEHLIE